MGKFWIAFFRFSALSGAAFTVLGFVLYRLEALSWGEEIFFWWKDFFVEIGVFTVFFAMFWIIAGVLERLRKH